MGRSRAAGIVALIIKFEGSESRTKKTIIYQMKIALVLILAVSAYALQANNQKVFETR